MANSTVTAVYRFVIDDVITNVRRDFEDMGVDETIMHELQRSWEAKLAQSKVAANQPAEPAAAVESYPFEEPAYEQPATSSAQTSSSAPVSAPAATSASTLTPTTSAAVHPPTLPPLPSLPLPPVPVAPPASAPVYNYRVEQTPAANLANSTTLQGDHGSVGRPQQYAPSRGGISLPGGGRNGANSNNTNNNIPQHDGPADAETVELEMMNRQELDAYIEKMVQEGKEQEGEMMFTLTMSDRAARKMKRDGLGPMEGFSIGQLDGGDDDDNNGTEDDTGLGSDLDDSDGDMDEESDNIVLCQYDKVSRTKSKWKCVLKDGIMLINGRDYLFHKANGDFEW